MVHQPTLVVGLDSISISTVHAGDSTSFVVSEAGELFAWSSLHGYIGGLATGTTDDRRAGPERVEALRSVKVRSLGGTFGLVAVATNAETGNEEFYTWGGTCVYIRGGAGILLEPRRFELSSATNFTDDDDDSDDDDDDDDDEDSDDDSDDDDADDDDHEL